MPLCQYRRGGGNRLFLYIKRWYWWGYSKVECVTSRRYAVASKIVDKIGEIRELISEYERLDKDEKRELQKIDEAREDNANHGKPEEMSLPKGHQKYRKATDEPDVNYWCPIALKIKHQDHFGLANVAIVREGTSVSPSNVTVERVIQHQPFGDPNNPPKNKGKGKNNNQQDHQH